MLDSPMFSEGQVVGSGDVRAVVYGEDRGLWVEFFKEPLLMEYKTEEEGRPIYEDMTLVRIYVPGDKTKVVVRKAYLTDHDGIPADPKRWPEQWRAFQAGEVAVSEGTPLVEWPRIGKSQIEELKYFKINTVEQLAAVSDSVLENMGHGTRPLRDSAMQWLARSNEESTIHKMEARHADEMKAMQAQLEQLRDTINSRGPGRPKKEVTE